jgi:bacterioferritin-associated ferredoxin
MEKMIVCNCKMVYTHEIERFVKKYPSSTFQEMTISTGASTGCGRCRNSALQYYEICSEKYNPERQLSIDFER